MKKSVKRRKPNVIGENLRYLLKKQGVKAADLARAIGCYYKTVYFWVHGTNIPDSVNREKICDYFGITEAQLVSEGLAIGCPSGEEEVFNTLVRETGLIGVTPDDILRLGKQQKLILRDLIKDWTDRRSQQIQALTAARLGKAHRKVILIVHNHPGVCFALKRKLQEFGYHVLVAADGSGGLRCLRGQARPCLGSIRHERHGRFGILKEVLPERPEVQNYCHCKEERTRPDSEGKDSHRWPFGRTVRFGGPFRSDPAADR